MAVGGMTKKERQRLSVLSFIVALGIGAFVIFRLGDDRIGLHDGDPSLAEPGQMDEDLQIDTLTNAEVLSVGEMETQELEAVFGLADSATKARLAPWLEDVYLKSADFNDARIGSELIAVDTRRLQIVLGNSLQDRLENQSDGISKHEFESDFLITLSEATTFRSFRATIDSLASARA